MSRKPVFISLFVDDFTPIVNLLFYMYKDVFKKPFSHLSPEIPFSFLEEFSEWASREGVKGKLSLVPNPAGLGCISSGIKGYSKEQTDNWLHVVRNRLGNLFEITPEVITHTLAMDISTGLLTDVSEWEWIKTQTYSSIYSYIDCAFRLLADCGIESHGLTCAQGFGIKETHLGQDDRAPEEELCAALMDVQNRLFGHRLCWYYGSSKHGTDKIIPEIMLHSEEKGSVVKLFAAPKVAFDIEKVRRFAESGSYIILPFHWWDLYGEKGGRREFYELCEFVGKIKDLFDEKIAWVKPVTFVKRFIRKINGQAN